MYQLISKYQVLCRAWHFKVFYCVIFDPYKIVHKNLYANLKQKKKKE